MGHTPVCMSPALSTYLRALCCPAYIPTAFASSSANVSSTCLSQRKSSIEDGGLEVSVEGSEAWPAAAPWSVAETAMRRSWLYIGFDMVIGGVKSGSAGLSLCC